MKCPSCAQQFTDLTQDQRCPLCGAAIGVMQQALAKIYVIVFALLMSCLLYAVVAVVVNLTQKPQATAPPQLRDILLVAALAAYVLMVVVERSLLTRGTVRSVQMAITMAGALAESIAVMGLVLFFLGQGLQLFAAFFAMSLVGFGYLLVRMPVYVKLLCNPKD